MDTTHKMTLANCSEQIIQLSKTNRALAEKEFAKLDTKTQVSLVRESNYDENIITLAQDATQIFTMLNTTEAFLVLDKADFGESIVLECLTPEQYMFVLDQKSWIGNPNPHPDSIPKTLDLAKGLEIILALKDVSDDEKLIELLDAIEVSLLYAFLYPHIVGYRGEISLFLYPTFNDIEIEIQQGEAKLFSESDIEDLLIKIQYGYTDFFLELCELITENKKPNITKEFYRAAERNPQWFKTNQLQSELFAIGKEIELNNPKKN